MGDEGRRSSGWGAGKWIGTAGVALLAVSLVVRDFTTCDENGCRSGRLLGDPVAAAVLFLPLTLCLAWLAGALRGARAAAGFGAAWAAFVVAMTPLVEASNTDTTIEVGPALPLVVAGYLVLLVGAGVDRAGRRASGPPG